MSELPELSDLIPRITGAVYAYQGRTWLAPARIADGVDAPDHGVVRCGFRLYELLDWNPNQGAWEVRAFSCTLSDQELTWLANGVRPDGD